jgi:hypothetical protein
MPAHLRTDYAERLGRLLQIKPQEQPGAEPAPHTLVLSAEARARWEQFHDALEEEVGFEGELGSMSDWACKLCGTMVRIAGLLHLAEHGETGARRPIGEDTVRAALAIGDYFTANALAVFELMKMDHSLDAARDLLAHVHARCIEEASVRELHVALSRSRFPKSENVTAGLAILEDYGWAHRLPQPPTNGRGRPASPRYRFAPPQKPRRPQKRALR